MKIQLSVLVKHKITYVIILLSTLLACSNTNVEQTTYYYLLTNPVVNNEAKANKLKVDSKLLYSVSVDVAEYLDRPNLVMQLDHHQIHYSLFHLWAEPLSKGLKKSLLFDLNKYSETLTYKAEKYNKKHVQQANHLEIAIDYFHVTNTSKVILSGSYMVNGQESDRPLKQNFTFEETLLDNGYAHSVEKMRALITVLVNQIIVSVEKHD